MIKVLELFSGIGACSKALERLGIEHEIVDAVEIDKYAVKSFNAVHGTNFEPQDITKWDKDIECDLIMHGSPCQDFSVAGLGKGGDKDSGTRSSLMYETLRIVEKLKPKYVIWENVKNLLSKKHQHNYFAYIKAMADLGYKSYGRVLNAKDYGVPQNRERVFTVSILNGENFDFPKADACDNEIKKIDIEQQVSVRKYPVDIEKLKKVLRANKTLTNNQIAERLNIPVTKVEHWFRNDNSFAIPDKDIWYSLKDLLKIETDEFDESITTFETKNNIFEKSNRCYFDSGLAPTITSSGADEKIIETSFSFPEKQELKISLKDVLEDNVDEKYYLTEEAVQKMRSSSFNQARARENKTDVCRTLCARDYKDPQCVMVIDDIYKNREPREYSESCPTLRSERAGLKVAEPFCVASRGRGENNEQHLEPRKDGNTNTITSVQKDNYVVIGSSQKHAAKNYDGICPTLTSAMGCGGGQIPMHDIDYRIRKLTPKECWRLMGFDDSDFEKAEKVNSNTQLYKQAGNSIVVNVLEGILKNLLETRDE